MMGTRLTAVPVLLVVVVALATGLLAGLVRIGWTMPAAVTERAILHGPLLATGVLGTLIGRLKRRASDIPDAVNELVVSRMLIPDGGDILLKSTKEVT